MYSTVLLLVAVTALYAGYNLLIKFSSDLAPESATTTILATIALQMAALAVSLTFAAALLIRGGQSFTLPIGAFGWAVAAGLCIGAAEVGYFYLFRGIGGAEPILANLAIPTIVGGTILITLLASWLVLNEPMAGLRLLGAILIIIGIIVMFTADSSAAGR